MSIQSIEMPQTNAFRIGLVGLVGTLIALVAFSGALMQLVNQWASQEEYSHGFLIPIVTVWLLWMRRDALRANVGRPVWAGPVISLLAIAMHIIGEMSAISILSQVGFVLALVGLVLGLGGYPLLRTALLPILFLLFAIPMPASSIPRCRFNFSLFRQNSEPFSLGCFKSQFISTEILLISAITNSSRRGMQWT